MGSRGRSHGWREGLWSLNSVFLRIPRTGVGPVSGGQVREPFACEGRVWGSSSQVNVVLLDARRRGKNCKY